MQHMLNTEDGGTAFVDFFVVPQEDDDDDEEA